MPDLDRPLRQRVVFQVGGRHLHGVACCYNHLHGHAWHSGAAFLGTLGRRLPKYLQNGKPRQQQISRQSSRAEFSGKVTADSIMRRVARKALSQYGNLILAFRPGKPRVIHCDFLKADHIAVAHLPSRVRDA